MTPLLQVKALCYQANGKKILDSLSMEVGEGEIHAILGTNGTGKSTLACILMGLEGYAPSSGSISFGKRSLEGMAISERAKLGITLAWQEPARFEGITVKDYLTVSKKETDPARLLELTGLDPSQYLGRMADKTLSGGERKRIELASVLGMRPRLAILDEPDSGIDMLSMDDIKAVMEVFRTEGAAVLLITHRLEITLMADRASQLCGGRIICTGEPSKVADFYRDRKCLLCDKMECKYV